MCGMDGKESLPRSMYARVIRVASRQGHQGRQGYVRDLYWTGTNQGYVRDFGNFPEKSGTSDLWLKLQI